MVIIEDITKIFKSDLLSRPFVALENVSFSVPEGSMVGFLGANGAGKTTTMKIMMDFIQPTQGRVRFLHHMGSNRSEIFRNIGFLPERPYFYQQLTGREFLRFMGGLSEMRMTEVSGRIAELSPKFKMDYALDRELKTYSKGMLQRVGFMATVLHKPKLIVLDEPLSGLDPVGRKEFKDLISEVHKEGTTVFFSTHIVSDVEAVCDRVIFLKSGKLLYDGGVSDLLGQHTKPLFSVRVSKQCKDLVTQVESQKELAETLELTVTAAKKDELLRELLQKNESVLHLEAMKPSLEEIFYQTKRDS